MLDLDIIIPVQNEEKSINELTERLVGTLDKTDIKYRLTYIDDNSTDNTLKRINEQIDKDKSHNIRFLIKKGKVGKAYSILQGARNTSAKFIAMIDGDLQYPPEIISVMYKKAKKFGMVVANRKTVKTSTIRK